MQKMLRMISFQILIFIAILGLYGGFISLPAQAASSPVSRTQISEALGNFHQEVRGANQVINKANGLLVFPNVYQGAFVVGGEYGKGALLVHNKIMGYYRLTQGSLGWQIGGQKKTIIIAFMTPQSLQSFLNSSGWDIGASAEATIITVGAEGDINATTLKKPVLGFVLDQKGLMAGVSLQGLKISRI